MSVATCFSGSTGQNGSFCALLPSDPKGFVVGILDTRNPGAATPGMNWAPPMFHNATAAAAQQWRATNLGEVFGIALDGQTPPNIYVTATSLYAGDQMGPGGFGGVYKLDGATFNISTFISLSGVGSVSLGNICYDKGHNQFFISDLDSGHIRRVNAAGVEQLPAFDHGTTGRANQPLLPINDTSGPNNLTDAGRRVFGLQVEKGRLYYAVWDNSGNEIWSVGLQATGDFISAGAGGPRREITGAVLQSPFNTPITDIAFSQGGKMLLGERNVCATDPANLGTAAHNARVIEFALVSGVWTATVPYQIGAIATKNNATGGVDYDCNDWIYATADAIQFGPQFVYGVQILPAGVTTVANSYQIDLDGDITSLDKTFVGDVEVYRCCDCLTLSEESLECLPGGNRTYTFTVQNHVQGPVSWLGFLSTTPGVVPATQLIHLPSTLTNGQSATVSVTLNIPSSVTELCYRLSAHNENLEECCAITNCVPVPQCCAVIVNEKFDLNPQTGAGFYSFCVTNLTANQVGYLYLAGDTNCLTFQTNIIALTPVLGPNQGVCLTVPVMIGPNCTNACFTLMMATTNFVECCTVQHCFSVRKPPENRPPVVLCKELIETCAPTDFPVGLTVQVMDPEGDPLQVIIKVDGTPVQTNNLASPPAGQFVSVNFTVSLSPGSHTISYCVSDGHGPLVVCTTVYHNGDVTPPQINCPPNYKICGVLNYTIPSLVDRPGFSVSDNCSRTNEIKVTQSPPPGTVVGQGTTCITLTAFDAAGNSTSCQTCVTVALICIKSDFPVLSFSAGSTATIRFETDPNVTRRVGLFVDGVEVGSSTAVPFDIRWTNIPPGLHTIWAEAQLATGKSIDSAPLLVVVGPASAAGFAPVLVPGSRDGQFGFSFSTMPGEQCFVERSETLQPDSWRIIENTVGDGNSMWFHIEQAGAKAAFYRVRVDR